MNWSYLQNPPTDLGKLKAENEDFKVIENLGYEMTGEGEFVALRVRKNGANTLFVGEKLAKFAEIPVKNMGYAGLKDRNAITEQWFCLQMPGLETPDFSTFELNGVEILDITRHNRKIRVGSLDGNHFELLLRDISETEEMKARLEFLKIHGFPNYFGDQRFGREDNNLSQAMRWAKGEIKVKDRKKRGFYLSSARSFIFNKVLSKRLEEKQHQTLHLNDVLQLSGSRSFFTADESQDFDELKARLESKDVQLTAPLIGGELKVASLWEEDTLNHLMADWGDLWKLMKQEKMSSARRALFCVPQNFSWQFEAEGLRLKFYLPAGSYATSLVRELIQIET